MLTRSNVAPLATPISRYRDAEVSFANALRRSKRSASFTQWDYAPMRSGTSSVASPAALFTVIWTRYSPVGIDARLRLM